MAEITDAGFTGKTQNEYFEEEIALYQGIDPAWNLDPSTPDGLKAQNDSEVFALLDEGLRLAYNSKDPNTSAGLQLDILAALTGTQRTTGTSSSVELTVTGTDATVIPQGSLVEDTNGNTWDIDANTTISGATLTDATCVAKGAIEANAATITKIKTIITGWATVTNIGIATPGTDPETDGELRLRRSQQLAAASDNQVDSMTGEILGVEDVRHVRIYENDTGSTDADGLVAHSIAVIVDGGTDADVALAIYLKKNPGCALHAAGTPVVIIVQSPTYLWQQKSITFVRPTPVDIVVATEIVDDGSLPAGVEDEIIQAFIDYAAGDTDPGAGFNTEGFSIGEDVVYSRMYTPINSVIGKYGNSYVNTLTIQADTANVAIAFNELSRWTEPNISVVIS